MNIIHLSDLHIGRSNNLEKISQLVQWILNQKKIHQSSVVAISGDITDDGAEWQFQQAREMFDRLTEAGFTVLPVPGNHDYGLFGITESKKSAANFRKYIGGQVEYPHLVVIDRTAFLLLNSMEGELPSVEMIGAEGSLGKKQLKRLAGMLEELGENPDIKKVVLILHHHPFDLKKFHVMRDAGRFLKILKNKKQMMQGKAAVLFGHKHVEKRFNDPEDHKEDSYGLDLIYASGSIVERNQEGKMVVPVIDLDDLVITRYKID